MWCLLLPLTCVCLSQYEDEEDEDEEEADDDGEGMWLGSVKLSRVLQGLERFRIDPPLEYCIYTHQENRDPQHVSWELTIYILYNNVYIMPITFALITK